VSRGSLEQSRLPAGQVATELERRLHAVALAEARAGVLVL